MYVLHILCLVSECTNFRHLVSYAVSRRCRLAFERRGVDTGAKGYGCSSPSPTGQLKPQFLRNTERPGSLFAAARRPTAVQLVL